MAKEALEKLEQAINIEYYIGKPNAEKIRKACNGNDHTIEEIAEEIVEEIIEKVEKKASKPSAPKVGK